MQIPAALSAALEDVTARTDRGALRTGAAAVSGRYRERDANLQIRNAAEAAAYLGARFPATYASARRAMDILCDVAGADFCPRRMLDVGAGPGTVMFAARDQWDSLEEFSLVEPNAHLREAGQALCAALDVKAQWLPEMLDSALPGGNDLVTAGYVLNELPEEMIAPAVERLWAACDGVLLIIEPGTPGGSAVMQRARDTLRGLGAALVGPCPQNGVCPLRDDPVRWCHFSVRVDRSRLHRLLKEGATLSYEDEKFSFIAATRHPIALPDCRIIGYPAGTKVLRLPVCTADARAVTEIVPKSHPGHKASRKLEWGDAFSLSFEKDL